MKLKFVEHNNIAPSTHHKLPYNKDWWSND